MTVIELAFTISILGLMMYFALRGEALVQSMRGLAVSYELQQYQRLVLSYQANFGELPGDDELGPKKWRREPTLTTISDDVLASTAGDGKINGKLYDIGNPSGEQFAVWRDLRFAGMVDGDPQFEGASALPENPFGGFYAFDEGNLGQRGGSLCATKVPGSAALQIDTRIDDGKINEGLVVATSKFSVEQKNHFDTPDTEPYNVEKEYIICLPMLP